jgi:leucyl aminopeptidase
MEPKLIFADASGFSTPMLALFAVDLATGRNEEPRPLLLTQSSDLADAAARALGPGEFKAALGETALIHATDRLKSAGFQAERLLLVGLGKAKDLSLDKLRKGAGTAVRAAKARSVRNLAIAFPDAPIETNLPLAQLSASLSARALVEGAQLAELDWDTYHSDRKDSNINELALVSKVVDDNSAQQMQAGFHEGLIVAAAQNFTRSLVNEPGNVLTPTELGARAKAMCDEAGLACEVYSTEKIRELKMEPFWSVAKGSAEPPALIVMTYEPSGGAPADSPILGLVGKGITFDSGGISLKPGDGMEKMKYDMAGAAAMIGAMHAIARLKPAVKVVAVVCAAENMPGGRASKPGDVVTAMSGTTIEIVNTDAEGRRRHADRSLRRRAWHAQRRPLLQRRGCLREVRQRPRHLGRELLAASLHRRLSREHQQRNRRHQEHRQEPLGRSNLRRNVPQGVCGRYALGASGHRRLRLERGEEALAPLRSLRRGRAFDCGVGAQLLGLINRISKENDFVQATCDHRSALWVVVSSAEFLRPGAIESRSGSAGLGPGRFERCAGAGSSCPVLAGVFCGEA